MNTKLSFLTIIVNFKNVSYVETKITIVQNMKNKSTDFVNNRQHVVFFTRK